MPGFLYLMLVVPGKAAVTLCNSTLLSFSTDTWVDKVGGQGGQVRVFLKVEGKLVLQQTDSFSGSGRVQLGLVCITYSPVHRLGQSRAYTTCQDKGSAR